VDGDELRAHAVPLEVVTGLEVHGRRRSTVNSQEVRSSSVNGSYNWMLCDEGMMAGQILGLDSDEEWSTGVAKVSRGESKSRAARG
jgi:hypothetical protein